MHTHLTDVVSAQAVSGFVDHPTHDRRNTVTTLLRDRGVPIHVRGGRLVSMDPAFDLSAARFRRAGDTLVMDAPGRDTVVITLDEIEAIEDDMIVEDND